MATKTITKVCPVCKGAGRITRSHNSEERNEKELRSIRNAIEIIKKLFAENTELRKRLED